MAGICLTMDVGGSSVKYALIGPDRSLTEHGKVPTPHDDRAAYLDALAGRRLSCHPPRSVVQWQRTIQRNGGSRI